MEILLHTLARFATALSKWLLSHAFHCWYGHRLSNVSAKHHFSGEKKVHVRTMDFTLHCVLILTAGISAQLNETEQTLYVTQRTKVKSLRYWPSTSRGQDHPSQCCLIQSPVGSNV